MGRSIGLALASAISLGGLGAASAADMAVKARPAPVVPVYSWTGCYIGINGGGKWATTSGSVNPPAVTAAGFTSTNFALPLGSDSADTGIVGGQVGCNLQTGNVVIGVEGDADWQNWNRTRTVTAAELPAATRTTAPLFVPGDTFDITGRWQASLRGRIGYAWDRTLLYATGGVGFTGVRMNSNWIAVTVGGTTFPATLASDTQTFVGPTVGAGLEYAVTNNLSLAVEGRYTWYGSHDFNNGLVAAVATTPTTFVFTPVTSSINLNTAEVTARLNWKFNSSPIVAKY